MMENQLNASTAYIRFPWYETIEGDDLEQGDIFERCPVFTLASPFSYQDYCSPNFKADFSTWELDVIVMTQSCDLVKEHPKINEVLLCPLWDLEKLATQVELAHQWKGKEDIRRGNVPGYLMLYASTLPGFERPIRAVSFHRVYSLPLVFLRGMAQARGKRLRLLPPYREHLGQAFARYFMRVGLPVDIPPFKK
ncbi:hypothetical protein L0337_07580 [candidate division KSB1 bacterium]|nr:hypothetical protein [candidate division KSB1 bacterium]